MKVTCNVKAFIPLTRKDLLLLGVLGLVALVIKLHYLQFVRVIAADGVAYVEMAQGILNGEGLKHTHFPPFYPILIAFMHLIISDGELAGQAVSIFMGSLIVVPVYLLAVEFFSKKVGAVACILTIVWPSIITWSCSVVSQPTYISMILFGIYFTWRAFEERSMIFPVLGGIMMALSYLTREEGFIVFFGMTIVLMVSSFFKNVSWKKSLAQFSICWAAFLLISSPYLYNIHEKTGKWQLTKKTDFGLNQVIGSYTGKIDLQRDPERMKLGYVDVLQKYPEIIRMNLAKNLRDTWNIMAPPYIWFLFVLGFIMGRWDRDRLLKQIFLLSTFAPLLIIIPFFFIGPEYVQPYQPIFFMWAGHGLLWIDRKAVELVDLRGWWPYRRLESIVPVPIAIISVYACYLLLSQMPGDFKEPYHFSHDGGRYDRKKMGLLLKKYLPENTKVMSRWGRISFYAGVDRVDMPQADLRDIISTAKKSGARYLFVDGELRGLRPQLGFLFKPLIYGEKEVFRIYKKGEGYEPFPGIRLFILYKDPNSTGIAVYEVE